MSTVPYAITDSATMLRRSLRHMQRYPSLTILVAGMPVVFMLLFVYVFGGTLGTGIGGAAGGRAFYVNYVVPGILLLAVAAAAQGTAVSVAMDMTEGIIARFRTMAIARVSVLTGHVLGSMIKTAFGLVVVTGVALLTGFRPTAGPGMARRHRPAGRVHLRPHLADRRARPGRQDRRKRQQPPMFLMLLPFLSSAFVPTDSMPPGLRAFAEYQPFTPITETLRGLFFGTPIGSDGIVSLAWCAGIALVSFLWARKLFSRDPIR